MFEYIQEYEDMVTKTIITLLKEKKNDPYDCFHKTLYDNKDYFDSIETVYRLIHDKVDYYDKNCNNNKAREVAYNGFRYLTTKDYKTLFEDVLELKTAYEKACKFV